MAVIRAAICNIPVRRRNGAWNWQRFSIRSSPSSVAHHLGTRLILVLGHQSCGAVKAARETIAAKGKAPGHIESLVAAIKPAVEATAKDDLDTTVKANVKNVVQALRSSTPILKAKVDSGDVQVIGGYYSLDTGAVTFLGEK